MLCGSWVKEMHFPCILLAPSLRLPAEAASAQAWPPRLCGILLNRKSDPVFLALLDGEPVFPEPGVIAFEKFVIYSLL